MHVQIAWTSRIKVKYFKGASLITPSHSLSNESIKCFVSDPKLYIKMDAYAGHVSNPFVAKISLQILPAVYHTIPMLLVWRIWYFNN